MGSRIEYLIATNRDVVPYFAMPAVGSKSGLRGFSKERFRNFALAVLDLEFSFPLLSSLEGYLLSNLAQTASNPAKIPGKHIQAGFGLGLRIRNVNHPVSFGFARSPEDWKFFATIAIGSPW